MSTLKGIRYDDEYNECGGTCAVVLTGAIEELKERGKKMGSNARKRRENGYKSLNRA